MDKFNIEISIVISFILGLILPLIGLGGILSLIVMGFVATYITRPEYTSAKVGAIATGVFCLFFFFYGFLTPPTLPYVLPNPLSLGILVSLQWDIQSYSEFDSFPGNIRRIWTVRRLFSCEVLYRKKGKKSEIQPKQTTKNT